jgi:hypothetical protein
VTLRVNVVRQKQSILICLSYHLAGFKLYGEFYEDCFAVVSVTVVSSSPKLVTETVIETTQEKPAMQIPASCYAPRSMRHSRRWHGKFLTVRKREKRRCVI